MLQKFDKELTSLRARLLSERDPFSKPLALPKGRQSGIRRQVVNIPVNSEQVWLSLSKNTICSLIPLKLKRKQPYKSYDKFEYACKTT